MLFKDIEKIEDNKSKFNTKLILEVKKYLEFRTISDIENREFLVKGKLVKTEKSLKAISDKKVKKLSKSFKSVLMEKFKGKELFPEIVKEDLHSNSLCRSSFL